MDKKPFMVPAVISAIMLFLALGAWPYGYYQLVRLVACGSAVFIAYTAFQWKCMWAVWTFGFIALLFNPIAPVHLDKDLWKAVDLGTAVMFLISISAIKKTD